MEDTALKALDNSSKADQVVVADDERSFSFGVSQYQAARAARLLAKTADDPFSFLCHQQEGGLKGLHTRTDSHIHGRFHSQNSTQNSARRKFCKSFGDDQDLGRFRESILGLDSDPCRIIEPAMCPADDLFYKGQLLPLYSHSRLQMLEDMMFSSSRLQTEYELLSTPCFYQTSRSYHVDQASRKYVSCSNQASRNYVCWSQDCRPIATELQPVTPSNFQLKSSEETTSSEMRSHDLSSTLRPIRRSTPCFELPSSSKLLSQISDSPPCNFKMAPVDLSDSQCSSPVQQHTSITQPQAGKNSARQRPPKKSRSFSKAAACWHKSLRFLTKPFDRLHGRDDHEEQNWDQASVPRLLWFSDCKRSESGATKSTHLIKPKSNESMRASKDCNSARRICPSSWDEIHNGIEGAIAYCKQSQAAARN